MSGWLTTQEKITYEVIANSLSMAKSKENLTSLGITDMANEVLPSISLTKKRLCTLINKRERENPVDCKKHIERLRHGDNLKKVGST